MAQTDRIARLTTYLKAGRCLTRRALLDELDTSPATLKRDIAYLRDRMNMPVVFDRERGGYCLDPTAQLVGTQYELPGLWFKAEEIHALLTMQHLLAHLDTGGLLGPHIAPLADRLDRILGAGAGTRTEVAKRIRVQTVGARKVHLPHFQAVGVALLRRQRLVIGYHGRGRDEVREREVSPQRLIHYRDNWYLDAWCHWRQALRSFSVDALRGARVLDKAAIDVDEAELDAVLGAGYGIFAGREVQWAELRFSAERARWVAAETWHPHQEGRFEADGRYVLRLPYADPRELVMDILRHVPEVEVLAPRALRDEVIEKLRGGLGGITP
ncbi:WYL domain-containing protein [Aquincola sp. MAHUQ-54]|uniref:WYL domain-containing protein n=1 Tax=Aquincola agrisoli TaxID=3119538 RepID=A0AAW9Q9V8_9BURK